MASEPEQTNPDTAPSAADPATALVAPLLFGRYRVERELGRGGMGQVVLAFDTKLRIHVAVKLVPDQVMSDSESAEDLRREVLRGIALTHAAVVRTHTFEQDSTGAAIVMEYVDGLTFTEWKEKQPGRCFEPADLLPWLGLLCEVLDYAHWNARIVHRDLKPRNIMATRDGRLKVADFGISAVLTETHSRLTGQGSSSGTPAYMSPQQARGKKPSPLDDVFALGATIYDLIAGKPPFFRGNVDTILMQVMSETPPSMAERREELGIHGKAPIPEIWEKTIAACLSKDPAERPQSCGEVFTRLQTPAPAPPAAPPPLPEASTPQAVAQAAPVAAKQPVARAATPRAVAPRAMPPAPPRKPAWLVPTIIATVCALGFGAWWYLTHGTNATGNGNPTNPATPAASIQKPEATPAPADAGRTVALPSDATKDAPFINSLGMKFVPVPETGVLFCIHETRYKDYDGYAAEAPDANTRWKNEQTIDGFVINERAKDHPVISVSWEDAQNFCAWLSKKEGKTYRLPTDREWSFAAGIGHEEKWTKDTTPELLSDKVPDEYPWGHQWPPPRGSGNYSDQSRKEKAPKSYAIYLDGYDDGFPTTAPVMSFKPNKFGLYDLGGNVSEWCEDWLDAARTRRVMRDEGWAGGPRNRLLLSHRGSQPPDFRASVVGFRCVLETHSAGSPSNVSVNATSTPTPPPVPKPGALVGASNLADAALAKATKDTPFVNSLGMKFVPVPITGGPTNGQRVLFSIWETRVQDYDAFCAETQRKYNKPDFEQGPTHPAAGRSWDDAQAFCSWLTDRERKASKLGANDEYRLPSDHEWSCAVGIGAEEDAARSPVEKSDNLAGIYPWGSAWPPPKGFGNFAGEELEAAAAAKKYLALGPVIPNYRDAFETTAPVGSFPGNALGLFDLSGNVWEWCENWAGSSRSVRVLRGGGWGLGADARSLLSSHRQTHAPSAGLFLFSGFRCVLATASLATTATTGTPAPTPASPTLAPPVAPAATPKPAGEIEKWLAQVDAIYLPRYQQEVVAPFEIGIATLRKNTLATLDREIASASSAAKLKDALALRNERQRIEADQGVPADDSDTPPAVLKTLRDIYRKQSASLEAARTKQLATVFTQFDQVLATNQNALTQSKRLDEALLLQQRRDALKKDWMSAPPKPGSPAAATKDRPFVNSLGMKFVPVPITGGPTSGQHVLFCIWETRVQDYEAFCTDTKHKTRKPDFEQGPTHSAAGVNWEEAKAFCAWLTDRERKASKLRSDETYRLPSDHEWSCAVGIGEMEDATKLPTQKSDQIGNVYPWGDTWPPPHGAGNFPGEELRQAANEKKYHVEERSVIANYRDSFETTAPVGSFPPNALGLFDLAGNVWEWCEDYHVGTDRVLRGGSWGNGLGSQHLLSSHRLGFHQNLSNWSFFGFRCVLALSSSPVVPAPTSNSTEPSRVVPSPVSTPALSPTPTPAATIAPVTSRPTAAAASRPDAALAKATKDAPFTNTLGMKFVPVPGTKVLFCIHETRRQDYAAYAAEAPGVKDRWKEQQHLGLPAGSEDNHPVTGVDRVNSEAFCTWLSSKEDKTYRLPTDKEWSYAVGIGNKETWTKDTTPGTLSGKVENEYPWGNQWPPPKGAGNYADEAYQKAIPGSHVIERYSDGFATTAPAMTFKPNKLGLYDMGGNAWEWVQDWNSVDQNHTVARGGSFTSEGSHETNSSHRKFQNLGSKHPDIGFRCVVEIPGQ